jgi:crotonobetainyl-CoA:carnitine CoA-transferase CaiB-like acyl-CoA transferase
MDYQALRNINPDLIMLSSCLSGQTGPAAMLAGYGTMGAVMSGFGELTGWPDRAPAAPYCAYTDYVAPRFTVAANGGIPLTCCRIAQRSIGRTE